MVGGTRWKVWAFLGALLLALVGLDVVDDVVTSRRRGSQPAAPVGGGAAAGGDLPSTSRPPPGTQPPPAAAGADRKVGPDKLVFDLVRPGEPTAWANLTYEHCDAHPLRACAHLPDYFEAHTASRSHLFASKPHSRIIKMSNTWSTLEGPNNQEFWVTTWPDGSPLESDDGQLRGVGTRTANSFTLNGWIVSGSEDVTDGDPCDGHVTTPSRCVGAIAGVERQSPICSSEYRGCGRYSSGQETDPRIAGGTIVLTCEFGMGTSTGLPGQKGSCTGIYSWTTPTRDIIWDDDEEEEEEPIDPRTIELVKLYGKLRKRKRGGWEGEKRVFSYSKESWRFPTMRDLVLDKCFRVLTAQDVEDIRNLYFHYKHNRRAIPDGAPGPRVKAGDLLEMAGCPESEDL